MQVMNCMQKVSFSKIDQIFLLTTESSISGEQYFIDKMPEAEEDELIITKSPGLIDNGPGLEVKAIIAFLHFFSMTIKLKGIVIFS